MLYGLFKNILNLQGFLRFRNEASGKKNQAGTKPVWRKEAQVDQAKGKLEKMGKREKLEK